MGSKYLGKGQKMNFEHIMFDMFNSYPFGILSSQLDR